MAPFRETVLTVIYRVLGFLFDVADDILLPFSRKPVTPTGHNAIDDLGDDEILEHIELPPDHPGRIPGLPDSVLQITPTIILKEEMPRMDEPYIWSTEAEAIRLVSKHTTIPVPHIRRVIMSDQGTIAIVMDIIPGQPLSHVWPSLPFYKRLWVAFTLRRYVRQLRSRLCASSLTHIGPPCPPHLGPSRCDAPSVFFDSGTMVEPFQTKLDFWRYMTVNHRTPHPSRGKEYDPNVPFVLCHLDLAPRNILLGDDGQLWLIDWAYSGYYPQWFEFLAMRNMGDNLKEGFRFWDLLVPFVCGPSFEEERMYSW